MLTYIVNSPQCDLRFNITPIKMLARFFCRYRQGDSNIFIESQRISNTQKTILKTNKVGRLTLPEFKTCYKAEITQ